MRALALVALALATALAGAALHAAPGPGAGGGARGAPGPGGGGGPRVTPAPVGTHWAGGPHRPGHGQGGWRHGHPGWGWGWGYGLGVGLGWGHGTAWALAAGSPWAWGSPWSWGAPAVVYGAPLFYPFGTSAPGYSELDEGSGFVQQAPAEIAAPAARRSASYWYYCTEPAGYYPAVQLCARPWIAVQPQTPPPGSDAQPEAATR